MSAILYDARGNEILVGFPDQVGGGLVTDGRTATFTLNAVNAEILMDINGAAVAVYDVRTAAASLTLVFEGTLDGVNYFPLPAFAYAQLLAAVLLAEQYVPSVVIATTATGQYVVGVSGLRRVRIRVSAFTSGTVTIAARASQADFLIYARFVPSTLHVTVTAAANTAATITLPAAGVGLFHYITNIHLQRNATAILAGTATLVATSTNLPGNPAWSYGNAMVAGGTQLDLNYTPTTPLKSLVANTATTIVIPAAGAAVLNRGNCSYYVGQ
jgi:hypothetical protein